VLLFIDNVFRFVLAGAEVSALLGRLPSAVGYQPTLGTEMGMLQERIHFHEKRVHHKRAGDIRARGRPYRSRRGHRVLASGASIVLSRQIVDLGIYPAVDPLIYQPILDPDVLGEEHYAWPAGCRDTPALQGPSRTS